MKILFLLQPHSNLLDFAGAAHVFQEAIDKGLEAEVSYCSYEGPITTSLGIPIGDMPLYSDFHLDKGDILFVLSTSIDYVHSEKFNPRKELVSWFSQLQLRGVQICAICNGAFLLGKAGLLDGKKCTTHWKRTKELRQLFPKAHVMENLIFVEDGGVTTSAGGTSGVDVALHILAKLKGEYFMHQVSRELVVHHRRNGSDAQQSVFLQYRNHTHSGIHQVQNHIYEHLGNKSSVSELADIACMSLRNFSRVFKKETGLSVGEYVNNLRMERARLLLKKPDLSRRQVARMVGLDSERQLHRILFQAVAD